LCVHLAKPITVYIKRHSKTKRNIIQLSNRLT
jgi:hypothetical protein